MPQSHEPRSPSTSGLITAAMSFDGNGVTFHAPLTFDGETVADEGAWFHPIDPLDDEAVKNALCDTYSSLHADWCARKEQQAAARQAARPRGIAAPVHTPCPALWAGR